MKHKAKAILIALGSLFILILVSILYTEVRVEQAKSEVLIEETSGVEETESTEEFSSFQTHQNDVSIFEPPMVIQEKKRTSKSQEPHGWVVSKSNFPSQSYFDSGVLPYIYVIDPGAIVDDPTENELVIVYRAIDSLLATHFGPVIILSTNEVIFSVDELDITESVRKEYETLLTKSKNQQ